MTIPFELENEILRLAHNEEWPVGTIASQLNIHRDVVIRVITQEQSEVKTTLSKPSMVEPYLQFLHENLALYPDICASRLFHMAKKRGYPGISVSHFRKIVARIRPKKTQEAFVKLSTLPGEQGQVDWAEFGWVDVPGGKRKLLAFVLTLSWSRAIFLRFYLGGRMVEFSHGFIEAFSFFGGVPKIILHDNLKSGVLERAGKLIRFNPTFLELARHYRFDPRAVAVRKGNQKGRVERSIRYIRENFYAGRSWNSVEELNKQAREWCLHEAQDRLWRQGDKRLVRDAYEDECSKLLALPEVKFPAYERVTAKIGKVPYARYDSNDYSVPAKFSGKSLTVVSGAETIQIVDEKENSVAEFARSYGKAQTIVNPQHISEVLAEKKQAQKHAGLCRLVAAIPKAEEFVAKLSMQNQAIGGSVSSLLKLMDIHGKERLSSAINEVIASGSIRLQSVHFVLKRLEMEGQHAPLIGSIVVPKHAANLTVQHHDLSRYDRIAEMTNDK